MSADLYINRLKQLVDEVQILQSKLILLVGMPKTGKTAFILRVSDSIGANTLDVGLELGRRLAAIPRVQRNVQAGTLLREFAEAHANSDLLLMYNIELLFDPSLSISPLDLLKRLAHSKRVVAAWPGELRGDRLIYADMSHPEHRDYSRDGVVVLEI